MNSVHFSSKTDLWSTPQDFFDELNAEFNFTLDVCATAENAKCNYFYTAETDGLSRSWAEDCHFHGLQVGALWMNPPYGSGIRKWIAKAAEEANKGVTVVCLIPARTDTRYWHEFVWDTANHRPREGVEVRFIKGRLKFGEAKASAPFPSAVVIFRGVK